MSLPLHLVFLALSLIAGVTIYFQKKAPLYLKLFPGFLVVTGIIEFISLQLQQQERSNIGLFNFYSIFEFCFFLIVLYFIIHTKRIRQIVLFMVFFYPALSVANILFVQQNQFHTITYCMGCLIIVIFSIVYFFELFKLPRSTNLTKDPAFWICSALLFFYICSFPLFGLIKLLSSIPIVVLRSLRSILILLNIFLYCLFTIAFTCNLKFRKPLL
jgi:hypothetical protein